MSFGSYRKYLKPILCSYLQRKTKINYHRNLNIYKACIPDQIHHIDLGLFKYQFDFTQDILKEVGETELLTKFDDYLCQIPHFPRLKLFTKLGQIKVMTTADYQHIMKIVFFTLNDIFDNWNNITCNEFCKLYVKFSRMYIMSKQETFTENDLKKFEIK